MNRASAGMLLYRKEGGGIEVLLIHPGGPFFTNRDDGAWSIPKGEIDEGEDGLAAALREFREETGCQAPPGPFLPLGQVRQRGGKLVLAWAVEGDCDEAAMTSNTFTLEWPRGSGQMRAFPEADRAAWFTLSEARRKINPAQADLLDALSAALRGEPA